MHDRHDRAYARTFSIDFKGISAAALASAKSLLHEWLPGGKFEGREYVALNPTRDDRALGSFKINWQTGEWSDFADSNAKGGDLISLFTRLAHQIRRDLEKFVVCSHQTIRCGDIEGPMERLRNFNLVYLATELLWNAVSVGAL